MTTPSEAYPQYEGRPVILIHITVASNVPSDNGAALAWCAPIAYIPDTEGSYPNIPRVVCPACIRARK
jgi:hypothetical protein